jgi:uncharacterized membrane protein YedE/YeeE
MATSTSPSYATKGRPESLVAYGAAGILFGIIITKAQVVSWFRIQEMFRFQSFYMYGILFSAIATAAIVTLLLRGFRMRSLTGETITTMPKVLGTGRRYCFGGVLFGIGWAFTGACPGPLFALVGAGITVMVVAVVSALIGTWVYGLVRPYIPH